MKTLYLSLLDYEMTLLKAIGACRAVSLTTPNKSEAVKFLSEALLSPAATAIALSDLSVAEKEALQFILDNGGRVEGPRFTRHYGVIRSMGPARLERERPWQKPVNPAERLWYLGLVFKAFQVTEQGSLEIVYIPDDLLPLLRTPNSDSPYHQDKDMPKIPKKRKVQPQKSLRVVQVPSPPLTISGAGRLRENFFSLLVYLQTTPVRLQNNTELRTKDRKALVDCLLPSLLPTFTPEMELDFLLHLGQRANLLVIKHGRLRPDRDPVRTWLQSSDTEQVRLLQNTWQADPTWNDLWRVPDLVLRPTGWENSPLLARSKILEYLGQVETSSDEWLSVDDFAATIKRVDPDFQRPSGDYNSWYIYDSQGNALMGFAHWDKVEGALIRHLLTHILLLLGVVEVGLPSETSAPTSFRMTSEGEAFLANRPVRSEPAKKPLLLKVDANFYARVPPRVPLYDRFQLARFAELDRRETGQVIYHITQASVGRALRNGVTADQMVAFLARATNNQTPLKVVETLRTWGARQGTVQIEQATLLRLKHENLVTELSRNPDLRPLLGEVIGPTTILVPAENVATVRRLLAELGYLEQ